MLLTLKQSKKRRTSSKVNGKVESDSDDAPLVRKTNGHTVASKRPPKFSETAIGESEDSDLPLEKKLTVEKAKIQRGAEKEAKALRKEDKKTAGPSTKKKVKKEASDDDEPVVRKKKQPNGVNKEDSDDDLPLSRKVPIGKGRAEAKTPSPKAKTVRKAAKVEPEQDEDVEEGEEEEEYRWWEDPSKGDGTTKWNTLEHAGVVFPPPYEPLPKKVRMKYDGVPVSMHVDAEEVAGFFGGMLHSTLNVDNPTFQKNFFADFTKILKETGGATDKEGKKVQIKEFAKCDFKPIFEHYEAERAAKKALSGAEKKALKAEKDAAEAAYMYCTWDGRKQKVGNFRVEPPGLFRGRGEHPKTGMVKKRVHPEQITINIGKEAKVPQPPVGHKWKEIKHDKEGTWLAMWQENINGAYKYVMLAANSDVKGQSDYKKFEKARELKVGFSCTWSQDSVAEQV